MRKDTGSAAVALIAAPLVVLVVVFVAQLLGSVVGSLGTMS